MTAYPCDYCRATHQAEPPQAAQPTTQHAAHRQDEQRQSLKPQAPAKVDPNAGNRACDLCGKIAQPFPLALPTPTVVTGRARLNVCKAHKHVKAPTMDALQLMVFDIPACPLCGTDMDPDQPKCQCGGRNWLNIMEIL
jgi:hypothetical protein